MMTPLKRFLPVLFALPLVLGGCSAYTHKYPNHSADQVWNAALAVAESPNYQGDWHVTENEVWVDDEWARIEIQRELRRLTNEPFTKASPEKRTWQFRVTMESEDPVVLSFENRNPTMPGWMYEEAERYFAEVSQLLVAAPEVRLPPKSAKPNVKFDEPMETSDEAEVLPEVEKEPEPVAEAEEDTKKSAPPVDLFEEP